MRTSGILDARQWAAAACVLLVVGAALQATAARAETRGGAFADITPSARAAALGGAMAALSEGSEALFANPAGLLAADRREAVFSHADLFDLGVVAHSAARMSWPILGKQVVWDRGNIQHVRRAPPADKCIALGVARVGVDLDLDSYSETQIALGYAFRLPAHVRGGFTYRFLLAQSDLEDIGATGHAVDVGTERDLGAFRLGVAARGLFSAVNWERGANEPVRPRFLFGLAWRGFGERLRLSAQGDLGGNSASFDQAIGSVEFRPRREFALRGAWRHREDPVESFEDLSAGFGVALLGLLVDYSAEIPASELGATHRFSVGLGF